MAHIKITKGGTRIGDRIYTPKDGVFLCPDSAARRLVLCGVAEYSGKAAEPEPTSTAETFDSEGTEEESRAAAERSEEAEPSETEPEEDEAEESLEQMTVEELRKYADEHGIELGKARKKADILNVIRGAETEAEFPVLSFAMPV